MQLIHSIVLFPNTIHINTKYEQLQMCEMDICSEKKLFF